MKTLEDLRKRLAAALHHSNCPCATPEDRTKTVIAVREIYQELGSIRALPENMNEV